jgi:hypothetical protein
VGTKPCGNPGYHDRVLGGIARRWPQAVHRMSSASTRAAWKQKSQPSILGRVAVQKAKSAGPCSQNSSSLSPRQKLVDHGLAESAYLWQRLLVFAAAYPASPAQLGTMRKSRAARAPSCHTLALRHVSASLIRLTAAHRDWHPGCPCYECRWVRCLFFARSCLGDPVANCGTPDGPSRRHALLTRSLLRCVTVVRCLRVGGGCTSRL